MKFNTAIWLFHMDFLPESLGIKIDVNIDTDGVVIPEKICKKKKNSPKYLFYSCLNFTTKKNQEIWTEEKYCSVLQARFKSFRQTRCLYITPEERFLSIQISYQSSPRYQEVKLYVREAGRIPRRGTGFTAMKEIDCITFLDRKPLKDDIPRHSLSYLSARLV